MSRASLCLWLSALLCGACAENPDASNRASSSEVSIASSSGSAISPDQLADARKWIARQREKAWTLFESVAALPFPSSGGPWHTEMDTFDRNAAVDKIRPAFADVAAQGLVLFNPDEREGPQIPKFPLYEATFYNDAAYRHIRIEGLYQEGSAEKLVAMQRREISEFRKGSRVLKTFWRPVPERGAAEREAWIGVWKWRAKYEPDNASRIDESAWPNVSGRQPVCVVAEEPANGCLIADQHFVTGKPADIGHIQCVQGMKCPENIDPAQTLILVAFHIADKSLPDWFWATFWWKGLERTAGVEWTCDNAQRPPSLNTGVWSYYSMDVGPSFRVQKPPISDIQTCGTPGDIGGPAIDLGDEYLATYNPFVEGVVQYGRKSSCLDCHARASSSVTSGQARIPPVKTPNSDYPDLRLFENHARTDYMWTLRRYMGMTQESSYQKP